jgi:hypothetical protein
LEFGISWFLDSEGVVVRVVEGDKVDAGHAELLASGEEEVEWLITCATIAILAFSENISLVQLCTGELGALSNDQDVPKDAAD